MDKSDPDFVLIQDAESPEKLTLSLSKSLDFKSNRSFIVYESQITQLLQKCLECDNPIINKHELKNDGSQYRLRMECLKGCKTTWCSQPMLSASSGKFNLN